VALSSQGFGQNAIALRRPWRSAETRHTAQRARETRLEPCPLVVDLDGTLVCTDLLHESAVLLLRDRPLAVLKLPFWGLRGKAHLKAQIATRVSLDCRHLPYQPELLTWLGEQHAKGRSLVLCTASDQALASGVAKHLGLFDEVMASDGTTNLAGSAKAQALVARFGERGFDYAGNASPDLAVWQHARKAVVVNAGADLTQQAAQNCELEREFARQPRSASDWGGTLRVHQWLKNLLLLMPLIAAHRVTDVSAWTAMVLAFVAFSFTASAVYITNDLFDLESDRQHPRKRLRPFASGRVAVWQGCLLAPALLAIGVWVGTWVGGHFWAWLLAYFALTLAYTWGLKRLLLLDCLALAMLYTLRVIAGGAAAQVPVSFWMLAFSVFLFLSLAFVKRYAELRLQTSLGIAQTPGRGYEATDAGLVQTMGIGSGYCAVLVLALYLNSDAVLKLYKSPLAMWAAVPVLLFWVSWMWMQAQRGRMPDDPLVFALRDRTSLVTGAVFAAVLVIGTVAWPW
jgi:4-hydroxybenzoate polyprenyltransferase